MSSEEKLDLVLERLEQVDEKLSFIEITLGNTMDPSLKSLTKVIANLGHQLEDATKNDHDNILLSVRVSILEEEVRKIKLGIK